ncbi:MAG: flagellar type III secretion system pore protein FliP [Pseudomonadota bacterium]
MRLASALIVFGLIALKADPAGAQDLGDTLSALLEGETSLTSRAFQIIALITILSLAPGIAVTVTCFPFIVTVLSILRTGLGLQASPPNMLIVSLALFLTYFVMEPIFLESWEVGLKPIVDEEVSLEVGLQNALDPFRVFMTARTDPETISRLAELRYRDTLQGFDPENPRLSVLVPAFMLNEIERAFQIGFLIFFPFLIIDLVVAAILMSMGMMMVPPAIVSLPFKLAFFVVADGWTLVAETLVSGYTS